MGKLSIREIVAREIDIFECAQPEVTGDIVGVQVFSGPGTVLEPLSKGDSPWNSWCDARRVQQGISIVLETTALRLKKHINDVTREDIAHNGPLLIYNGVPEKSENADLLALTNLARFRIPESRMKVFGQVGKRDIVHTGDQVESFPSDALESLHHGVVALVSNAPHFPRILRYLELHRTIPSRFMVRCFPIPSDRRWTTQYATNEIEALAEYLEKGYLAEKPYPTDIELN